MFEKRLEDAITCFWLDMNDKILLDKNGHFDLVQGFNEVTYAEAADLITHYYKVLPGVSPYETKRFKAIFNGLMNAFGPEFIERFKR